MNIEIFVKNKSDLEGVTALLQDPGVAGKGCSIKAVDLSAKTDQAVPGEVLSLIMQSKGKSLPITLVDGSPRLTGRTPTPQEIGLYVAQKENGHQGFTECADYVEDSSVQFPTRSRVHMNLIVKSVAESVKFYTQMFGQPPTKNKGDYAKFELADPPINLALMEDPHGGAKNHFGIQVKSSAVVKKAMARYLDAGFHMYEENETACCYAKQTKTWVVDPEGNQWEVFVTTDNAAQEGCAPDCICYDDLKPSMAKA